MIPFFIEKNNQIWYNWNTIIYEEDIKLNKKAFKRSQKVTIKVPNSIKKKYQKRFKKYKKIIIK